VATPDRRPARRLAGIPGIASHRVLAMIVMQLHGGMLTANGHSTFTSFNTLARFAISDLMCAANCSGWSPITR
jgi:hypothetical protein